MPPASTSAADFAIDVERMAKTYGKIDAVTDVSLQIPRGEAFGFLGPNGAGKTTSVKMLLGLVAPTGGGGTVLGRPLGDRRARAKIGYLPELFRYHDWMTAREELAFHAGLIGLARAESAGEIAQILETVGLTLRADDRIGTFSKGMQQRVGIGVAMLGSPDLIFLDEPTSALDPLGRRDVRALIHRLKDRGVTVFLNSHLLGEVEQTCDRVAIVARGRVVASGPVAELVGGATGIRVMLANVAVADPILRRYGTVAREGDWSLVTGVERTNVPAMVRELAAANVDIFALEPLIATLEQRFMEAMRT